jgi:glyoxylase-like metal-dependent hydrolase (beta-lactamase superfamily II)
MSAFPFVRPGRPWSTQERFPVVSRAPWGRIERVADGIWALVSTPLEDRTTLCNGGIIAGRTGVVVIEAFGSDEGALWMANEASRLVGRAPTHVVLTHYHGDHTGGLRGARAMGAPAILATATTQDATRGNSNAPGEILDRVTVLDHIRPTEIDLGDRSLIVVPRRGHTDSDVTIEVTDPSVVFCGDLVWNGMFPNYVDAKPSRLSQAVRLIRAGDASTYVPGHGALAGPEEIDRYIDLLDDVEAAARAAIERGLSAEEAGAEYRLPAGMAQWVLFNPAYFERAIGAWMAELQSP